MKKLYRSCRHYGRFSGRLRFSSASSAPASSEATSEAATSRCRERS